MILLTFTFSSDITACTYIFSSAFEHLDVLEVPLLRSDCCALTLLYLTAPVHRV